MNSTVGPSFNLTFVEIRTCESHELSMRPTEKRPNADSIIFQCNPNSTLVCIWLQLILLFSLFLLLFMGPFALFGIIHDSYCTILANFYLYLQYFQQKIISFNKISRSQTDSKYSRPRLSIASRKPIGVDMT